MFKCHPVPRCLQITIIRGCSLKIRAQFFKKQIAQSDVLAAVGNIYGLRACAVSSSRSLCAGDGPTAPWAQPSRDKDALLLTVGRFCTLTLASISSRGLSPRLALLKGFGQGGVTCTCVKPRRSRRGCLGGWATGQRMLRTVHEAAFGESLSVQDQRAW